MTQPLAAVRAIRTPVAVTLAVVTLAALWSYWTTLGEVAERWSHDPQYSHGYLVPLFALALLWLRRGQADFAAFRLAPSEGSWKDGATCAGMVFLAVSVGMRLGGTYFHGAWLDPLSLLPTLAGLCLLLGGWACLRWAWPSVAFLFFMIPLPYRASTQMAGQLQEIATASSTFLLQVLGLPAVAEGTTIRLNEVELGVVEACSGLRMLMVFFAMSTAVCLLMRKPLWERLLVCASAVPIALVVNILRITVTGVLHETVGKEIADAVFHDLAGWLMMPLALGFLALELKLLNHLLIEPPLAAPTLADPAVSLPAPTPITAPAAPAATTAAPPPPRPRRRRQARPEVAKPFSRG
jgi:exosortase